MEQCKLSDHQRPRCLGTQHVQRVGVPADYICCVQDESGLLLWEYGLLLCVWV